MKTAVCCIIKNENAYLREFVEYYKDLGFTNIILYDNNDSSGEDIYDVIGDYIENKFVLVANVKDKEQMQFMVYNITLRCFGQMYDWIAFFDCDEYLCLKYYKTINEYLETFNDNIDCICINWMQMTDNGMLDNDGRKLMERFTEPADKFCKTQYNYIYANAHIKSIIKCPSNAVFKNPHFAFGCNNYANADGYNVNKYMANWQINNEICWNNAYLKHFWSKTIKEYLYNKIPKGFADAKHENVNKTPVTEFIKRFFWINKHTPEKDKIIEQYLYENSIDISDELPR